MNLKPIHNKDKLWELYSDLNYPVPLYRREIENNFIIRIFVNKLTVGSSLLDQLRLELDRNNEFKNNKH